MICSVHVLAATHSDPNVAVSTVDWSLECQLMGVLLDDPRHGFTTDEIVVKICVNAGTDDDAFPKGSGSIVRSFLSGWEQPA